MQTYIVQMFVVYQNKKRIFKRKHQVVVTIFEVITENVYAEYWKMNK